MVKMCALVNFPRQAVLIIRRGTLGLNNNFCPKTLYYPRSLFLPVLETVLWLMHGVNKGLTRKIVAQLLFATL